MRTHIPPKPSKYRFPARPPKPPETNQLNAQQDAQINRINDLTRAGRTTWFGLLAYLVFAYITVLGV